MSTPVQIVDGNGTKKKATVTNAGQLVVGPVAYNDISNRTMGTDNTAVNFFGPRAGEQFVINSIILYANRNVGVNDATVVIYEATSATETTVAKTLFTTEMVKQVGRNFDNLNLLVNQGVYINGKTDDDDVFGTILGYYIPVLT